MSGEPFFKAPYLPSYEFSKMVNNFVPHGHRKKMSALLFPFSTLLVNNFHAEHLGRFFNDHPLSSMLNFLL